MKEAVSGKTVLHYALELKRVELARYYMQRYDYRLLRAPEESDYRVTRRKYELVSRAGKGFALFKRGKVSGVVYQEPTLPGFPAP